eukprot:4259081-Karenia_brevis.AAC.1
MARSGWCRTIGPELASYCYRPSGVVDMQDTKRDPINPWPAGAPSARAGKPLDFNLPTLTSFHFLPTLGVR